MKDLEKKRLDKVIGLLKRAQIGQGILEFALVLPIVMLLILGIIEFGRLMITYTAISSASREAARYGAAVGDDGPGTLPRYEDCVGIREAAKRVARAFLPMEDSSITIQYDEGPGTAVYSTCSPPLGAVQLGHRIVVKISATYEPLIPLGFGNFDVVSETRRTIVREVVVN